MQFPKKISPDRIKDSIVEVKYTSKLPFDILLGIFFKSLDDSYNYTNRQIPKPQQLPNTVEDLPGQITLALAQQSLFYTDKIKISMQPNKLVFNCLENYIGWESYFNEIKKTLEQISKSNEIDLFTRASVRYISEYPETDLKKCVKFNFTFGMPEVTSETYLFHSEFVKENVRVILNLNNKVPMVQPSAKPGSVVPVSQIDIDVINDKLKTKELTVLLDEITKVHKIQKETFFTLLSEDFLKTLNPIY